MACRFYTNQKQMSHNIISVSIIYKNSALLRHIYLISVSDLETDTQIVHITVQFKLLVFLAQLHSFYCMRSEDRFGHVVVKNT